MFKPNINRCVVDIETLGVNSHAPVLSIGAAILQSQTSDIVTFEFGINLNEYETSADVFVADQSTLDWWEEKEGSKAYEVAFSGKLSIVEACSALRETYIRYKCREVWANHPHFDITVLDSLFKHCKIETPWKYYEAFDVATLGKPFLSEAMKKQFKSGLTLHVVSHDALYEAKCLQYLLPRLQLSDPVDILY